MRMDREVSWERSSFLKDKGQTLVNLQLRFEIEEVKLAAEVAVPPPCLPVTSSRIYLISNQMASQTIIRERRAG